MTNSSLSSTRVTRIVNGVNEWVIYQTYDNKKSKLILLSFFKAPQVCFANQISGKFCVILFGFLPLTSVFRLVQFISSILFGPYITFSFSLSNIYQPPLPTLSRASRATTYFMKSQNLEVKKTFYKSIFESFHKSLYFVFFVLFCKPHFVSFFFFENHFNFFFSNHERKQLQRVNPLKQSLFANLHKRITQMYSNIRKTLFAGKRTKNAREKNAFPNKQLPWRYYWLHKYVFEEEFSPVGGFAKFQHLLIAVYPFLSKKNA